ncbi:hypothetical protein GN156_13030 [bacterium LRH843]|nr:hypothetical protein [bacterium LRH843]
MRGYLISIWHMLDPLYYLCTRLRFPPCERLDSNIFRVRLTRYKGKNIVLSDGTQINKNDTLVKIHLHNVRLLKELIEIKSEWKKAKMIYRYVQHSLPGLDSYIRNNNRSNEIKGIIGITFLTKGCERLGFEMIEISNPIYRWFKWCAFLPIEILSGKQFSIKKMFQHHPPAYLFMTKNTLAHLYRK